MKSLCFGTFAKVLVLCKGNTSQKMLVGTMLKSLDETYDITTDDAAVSNLLSCRDGFSLTIKDAIPNIRTSDIITFFKNKILPLLNPNKTKIAVLTVVDLIKEDETILSDTHVELINLISKEVLTNQKEFVFLDFIIGVFLYTLKVNNKIGESCAGDIDESYIDSFNIKQDSIKLIDAYYENGNTHGRTNIQNGNNNIMFAGDIIGGTFNFNPTGNSK